jgi:putative MATE family efflux protein
MRVALVVTVVKTVLNPLLIFGLFGFPRLELVGAGIATACSQVVGIALFARVIARAPRGGPVAVRLRDFAAARDLLPAAIRLALPGIGERLAMNLALLAYFRILSEYGTVAIAAYTVGIRILSFSWIPGMGFSAAAATLVGQALGRGEPDSATRAGWRATGVATGVALVLGGLCAVAREPLARLLTSDPATIAELGPFLLCLALAQPFLQSHFALGGAHRGAGDTWTPFVAATVANWALRIPLAVAVAFWWRADIVWVWSVLILDHAARSAWLLRSFRSDAWQRRLSTHR